MVSECELRSGMRRRPWYGPQGLSAPGTYLCEALGTGSEACAQRGGGIAIYGCATQSRSTANLWIGTTMFEHRSPLAQHQLLCRQLPWGRITPCAVTYQRCESFTVVASSSNVFRASLRFVVCRHVPLSVIRPASARQCTCLICAPFVGHFRAPCAIRCGNTYRSQQQIPHV